jgi:hypothetical protein
MPGAGEDIMQLSRYAAAVVEITLSPRVIVAAGVALAVLVLLGWAAPTVRRDIDPGAIQSDMGHAYWAKLHIPTYFVWMAATDIKPPNASQLRLLEDGHAMPLPHALHQDIRDLGAGRFSHWGDMILLSTSDNSDPRRNGRTYVAQVRLSLLPGLNWVVVVLATFLAVSVLSALFALADEVE